MPDWGFTEEMRAAEPFGITRWWLEPGKLITDPVHGDVHTTRLEQAMVDTMAFGRLRRVRQLGTTHLVYPGATHTRFSHSLGALRVVQQLFDTAAEQSDRLHAVPDLFSEWAQEAHAAVQEERLVAGELAPRRALLPSEGVRKLAEATLLARLGALLHDLGHIPFGHSIEDDLKLLNPHDENEWRFQWLWTSMIAEVESRLKQKLRRESVLGGDGTAPFDIETQLKGLDPLRLDGEVTSKLRPLILSKDVNGAKVDAGAVLGDYHFVADLVGNTICADLLDYLPRDHLFTGLPMSLGLRYQSAFYVTPSRGNGLYRGRMAMLLHRDGRIRHDVVTEVLKHLRYRYELQERVLAHRTKLAADAMLGKMLELRHKDIVQGLLRSSRGLAKRLERVPVAYSPEHDARSRLGQAEVVARWELECLLLCRGDDGVLETIGQDAQGPVDELVRGLLGRDLYRHAGTADAVFARHDLHERYSSVQARGELEHAAAAHAEVPDHHVVIWLPHPRMRLKIAEVLVDYGGGIAKFNDWSPGGGEIYNAHRQLWEMSVFIHPSLDEVQKTMVLARLAERTGLRWGGDATSFLGAEPAEWPVRLAAVSVVGSPGEDPRVEDLVRTFGVDHAEVAARGETGALTHRQLVDRMTALSKAEATT